MQYQAAYKWREAQVEVARRRLRGAINAPSVVAAEEEPIGARGATAAALAEAAAPCQASAGIRTAADAAALAAQEDAMCSGRVAAEAEAEVAAHSSRHDAVLIVAALV